MVPPRLYIYGNIKVNMVENLISLKILSYHHFNELKIYLILEEQKTFNEF
jgi:hypothetical protein